MGMNERGEVWRLRYNPATGQNEMCLIPVVVYAYYAADGSCLYVGQTCNTLAREHHHRAKSPWYGDVSTLVELSTHDRRGEALAAEVAAIRDLRPIHNVYHNRSAA